MEAGNRGNLAALSALGALLLAAALFFGPVAYRSWQFQQRCAQMLEDALGGRLSQVASYVQPEQRQLASTLFQTAVPANYTDYLHSLKLSNFSRESGDPDVIWALVTAKLSASEGGSETSGLAQGKLRWVWNGRDWEWDFEGSYGAEFPGSGNANWIRLGDFITMESGE